MSAEAPNFQNPDIPWPENVTELSIARIKFLQEKHSTAFAVAQIMAEEVQALQSVVPVDDPEVFVWTYNLVPYSIVMAETIIKDGEPPNIKKQDLNSPFTLQTIVEDVLVNIDLDRHDVTERGDIANAIGETQDRFHKQQLGQLLQELGPEKFVNVYVTNMSNRIRTSARMAPESRVLCQLALNKAQARFHQLYKRAEYSDTVANLTPVVVESPTIEEFIVQINDRFRQLRETPDPYFDQFHGMSPTELNTEFRKFIELIPTFDVHTDEDYLVSLLYENSEMSEEDAIDLSIAKAHLDDSERRSSQTNVHRNVLLDRMEAFLARFAHAPATFSALILDDLEREYSTGILKPFEDDPYSLIYKILDLSDAESGGLLDQETSPHVILECYRDLKEKEGYISEIRTEIMANTDEATFREAMKILEEQTTEKPRYGYVDLLGAFEQEYFEA